MPQWTYNGKKYGVDGGSPCTQEPADLWDLAFWTKKTGTKRKKNKRCTQILKKFGSSMWDNVDYVKVYNKGRNRGRCLFPRKSIKDDNKEERILKEINNSGKTKVAWFPNYCATCDPAAKKGNGILERHNVVEAQRADCTSVYLKGFILMVHVSVFNVFI